MIGCNAKPIATTGEQFSSIPRNGISFGSGSINNPQPQFQNPTNGFNSRPTYIASTGPFLPSFPTSPNAMGFYNQPAQQQQQQFGAQHPYQYVPVYGGNSAGDSQISSYYGQFRPGSPGTASVVGYANVPLVPLSPKYQTNLQFGQQPQLRQPEHLASSSSNHASLIDRMDMDAKASNEQIKKSSQI